MSDMELRKKVVVLCREWSRANYLNTEENAPARQGIYTEKLMNLIEQYATNRVIDELEELSSDILDMPDVSEEKRNSSDRHTSGWARAAMAVRQKLQDRIKSLKS